MIKSCVIGLSKIGQIHCNNLKKSKKRFYFPTAYEGLLTAKFIDGCVKSSSKKKWVQF